MNYLNYFTVKCFDGQIGTGSMYALGIMRAPVPYVYSVKVYIVLFVTVYPNLKPIEILWVELQWDLR